MPNGNGNHRWLKALARQITELREELGLTQQELARKMHTSQQAISRLEKGDYSGYTLKTLQRLAEAAKAELSVTFVRKNSEERRPSYRSDTKKYQKLLYDPSHEHDSCGVGFVANISGAQTHDVLEKGIQSVVNVTHRGAIAADAKTGDGAGVLTQLGKKFFEREAKKLNAHLKTFKDLAVGMIFLPGHDPEALAKSRALIEEEVKEPIAPDEEENTLPPAEEKARDLGWVDQEEWVEQGNSEEDWITHQEFNRRGELFDKIAKQNKRIKQMEATMFEFKKHHDKVAETSYKKALEDLKAQKIEAMENGEFSQVADIDEQLADLKTKSKETTDTSDAAFMEWRSENSWYDDDPVLREEADIIAAGYLTRNQDKTVSDAGEFVTEKIKKMYPEKFRNNNRTKPTAVGSSGTTTIPTKPAGNSKLKRELTSDEKKLGNEFVRQGLFKNLNEYKDDLAKLEA